MTQKKHTQPQLYKALKNNSYTSFNRNNITHYFAFFFTKIKLNTKPTITILSVPKTMVR